VFRRGDCLAGLGHDVGEKFAHAMRFLSLASGGELLELRDCDWPRGLGDCRKLRETLVSHGEGGEGDRKKLRPAGFALTNWRVEAKVHFVPFVSAAHPVKSSPRKQAGTFLHLPAM
jgi:hypothetical protein